MAGAAQKSAELVGRLERLPFSRWHRNLFILCFLGVMFDATDFALFGMALPPVAREFGLNQAQAGLLATVGLVGAFLGALFWGTISDYIGRRTSFAATVGIFAVFTGLVAASWNVLSLSVFRFISNFGLGGEVPVAVALTAEFSPGRIRGRMSGGMAVGFPTGLAVAAAVAYFIMPVWGWRAVFVVGVVPAALLFFVRLVMPESVRYLISRGRVAEAETTVAEIERQALAGEPAVAAPVVAPVGAEERGVTVFELLTPERWRRTILLWIVSFCFLWASNGIIFMLPTILRERGLPLSQILVLLFVQAVAAIVGYAACSALIDRFGRRPVLFLYYFVGAFFHLWFALATGAWLYVAIAAVGWVNPGVYGSNAVYVSELYPTHLRATAVGWFFGIGRIGSFLAPTVVGYMLYWGAGAYVLHTFALAFLLAAIALWFVGIETKGKVLEQITGEGAKAA
ncbi:MAG TPA: MFS transporter [Xanthobacteraceae bacterium]|nr:MFS transporter [Xanthobacteraceae bacterium]